MATEKKTDIEHGSACTCGSMSSNFGMGCNMHWMHWALRLAIILFVFWSGIKFGELKAMVEDRYMGGDSHYDMPMVHGYGAREGYYSQPQMMQQYLVPATAASTSTSSKK